MYLGILFVRMLRIISTRYSILLILIEYVSIVIVFYILRLYIFYISPSLIIVIYVLIFERVLFSCLVITSTI